MGSRSFGCALSDRCSEPGEEITGKTVLETPSDRHRTFALVADAGGRAEESEGSVVGADAREEHHVGALARGVLIAASGPAVLAGHSLT